MNLLNFDLDYLKDQIEFLITIHRSLITPSQASAQITTRPQKSFLLYGKP